MNRVSRTTAVTKIMAGTAVLAVGALASAMPASAADEGGSGVEVVNTETVQVYLSATGEVETQRIYEQLSLTGTGDVDLSNPVSPGGVRNLDGFGGWDVEDGEHTLSTTIDGERNLRSVGDFAGDLPLEVSVSYELDGEEVEPGDVVGESGRLDVTYTVENTTSAPQQVSFDDGAGGTITKTVDVAIPVVGSLTTVAPPSFENVASEQANLAGDGKGGTKLSFTMTLFPPIGSTTATFGYSADITDGVVPRAEISALPVNPLEVPTFKSAAASYQGGADTGIKLTEGATTIDSNLLKLRDGAAELLAGLIKLNDGAARLEAGLADEAAPGSAKLAEGMGQLDDGIGDLDDGANQLDDGLGLLRAGSADLADGAEAAADGGRQLRDGAGTLSGGLDDLSGGALELDAGAAQLRQGQKDLRDGLRLLESGVKNLPAAVSTGLETNPQYQQLLGGMDHAIAAIGSPTDVTNPATGQPATLFGGINAIRAGLAGQVLPGLNDALGRIPGSRDSLTCGSAVLIQLAGGATAPEQCGAAGLPAVDNEVEQIAELQRDALQKVATGLSTGVANLNDLEIGLGRVVAAVNNQFLPGIDRLKFGLNNPNADVNACATAKATPSPLDDCGLQQALSVFRASIPVLVDAITASVRSTLLEGISAPTGGCVADSRTLLCGADALVAGGERLKGGTEKLVKGSGELGVGGDLIYAKLGELAGGLGKISEGTGRLADGASDAKAGTGRLVDGTAQLRDGSGQLAAGAGELAEGLSGAADGSGRLAAGLDQAAAGTPRLVDGAQRLSDEGTKQLVAAGESTSQNYGEMVAVMNAGAQRADAERMVFGAPEGATGLAAYSFVINGEDGEGGRNVARGLAGLGVLGAGAGVLAARRRLF